MSVEFNSSLISKLYAAKNFSEIEPILEDMEEIKDPYFLSPLFDTFKKYAGDSFSHYFIRIIAKIDSKNTNQYLDKILDIVLKQRPMIISWVLDAMKIRSYFSQYANKLAVTMVNVFLDPVLKTKYKLDEFDLKIILDYLNEAKIISTVEEQLKQIFLNSSFNRREKAEALARFIRIDQKDVRIDFLIQNYEKIKKETEAELVLAKELVGWKGGSIPKLKELIIQKGNDRAREILQKELKDLKKKGEKTKEIIQKKEKNKYGNFQIIQEIVNLRKKVNFKTQARPDFNFQLFPDDELLIKQAEISNDENSLIRACINLRTIIQNIDKKIENHGLTEEKINELLPNIENKGKSFHQFYLYLKSRNIDIDMNLIGLRSLNRVLSLLSAHPENEKDLIRELEKNHIFKLYENNNWSELHTYLLKTYKDFLDQLYKKL